MGKVIKKDSTELIVNFQAELVEKQITEEGNKMAVSLVFCFLFFLKNLIFFLSFLLCYFAVLYTVLLFEQSKTAKIACNVIGVPTPTILWQTPTKFRNNQHNDLEKALIIENITVNDEGVYTCSSTQMNKFPKTQQRQITVETAANDIPKIVKHSINEIYVQAGDDFELNCKCSDCTPINVFRWTRGSSFNEEILENNNKITLSNSISYVYDKQDGTRRIAKVFNYTLKIIGATKKDEGDYVCYLENKHGHDRLKYKLNVLSADISSSDDINAPASIMVSEGETAYIKCDLNATVVQWNKNNTLLTSSTTDILQIDSTKLTDAGVYTCYGYNHKRFIAKNFTLLVIESDSSETKVGRMLSGIAGSMVILPCEIYETNSPMISWFSNGIALNTSDSNDDDEDNNNNRKYRQVGGSSLTFEAAPTDTGIYECRALNDTGVKVQDTILVVYGKLFVFFIRILII